MIYKPVTAQQIRNVNIYFLRTMLIVKSEWLHCIFFVIVAAAAAAVGSVCILTFKSFGGLGSMCVCVSCTCINTIYMRRSKATTFRYIHCFMKEKNFFAVILTSTTDSTMNKVNLPSTTKHFHDLCASYATKSFIVSFQLMWFEMFNSFAISLS